MPKKPAISSPYKGLVLPGMTADETSKLVASLYKKALQLMLPRHWEVTDLVSIGLTAAIEALPKWREDGGAARTSFCFRCGLMAMLSEARENMGATRIPYESARRNGVASHAAVDVDLLPLAAPFHDPEDYVFAHEMLEQLGPLAATTVVARAAGYTLEEVGRTRNGVTRQAVRDQLKGRLARAGA